LVSRGMASSAAFELIRRARPIVLLNGPQRARLEEWERLVRGAQAGITSSDS
jgi:hypothetical protein